ncbi:MAG: hypothetical protein Kow00124_07480 [Anaerolineae bacterium]
MALNSTALYPSFGVEPLHSRLGQRWADLIGQIGSLSRSHPRVMALALTMRRLRHKLGLAASGPFDPHCTLDLLELLSVFRGSEDDLLALYYQNLSEIERELGSMAVRQRRPAEHAA